MFAVHAPRYLELCIDRVGSMECRLRPARYKSLTFTWLQNFPKSSMHSLFVELFSNTVVMGVQEASLGGLL